VKSKKYLFVGIGVAAAIAVAMSVLYYDKKPETPQVDLLALDFTYDEANSVLKQSLQSNGITMSSPLKFQKQQDLDKWCKFLSDPEKQKLIEYCTSTELKDQNGQFVGNVHMVGSSIAPSLVVVALQSNPYLDNIAQVKTVFDTVTKELVCDCWNTVKPGGYETIGDWVDALRDFHNAGNQPHSQSKTLALASKHMQISLTTSKEGYVWQMLIAK
jgi:hypothetical protein